jgi:mono/diheme cytochrome c family protein
MRWALGTAFVVLLCTGAVRAQTRADSAASKNEVKTVASVMDVMKTMTIPFSDAVFEAGAEPPKNDAAWEAVRGQAVALAEAGNLLMIGSRVRDRAAWMTLSRAQVDAADAAAKAAAAKNAEQLAAAADAVYETCAACHKDYLK